MEQRNVIIIGGGPAGYAAAIRVSQLGGHATLVENETVGGTCLNRGCIPTRSLARAVELFDMAKDAGDHGACFKELSFDYHKMIARKDTTVNTLVRGVKGLLSANGVEVVEGRARFITPHKLDVLTRDGAKLKLQGRKIIVATGSKCKNIPSKDQATNIINTDEALKLTEMPKSILIVGAGFIGVAFATIFGKLGVKVCLMEEGSSILSQIDNEIVQILKGELEAIGVKIYTDTRVIEVEDGNPGEVRVKAVDSQDMYHAFDVQYVLMAETREANVGKLNLNEIGVELSDNRGVLVDRHMKTSVDDVFAVGDVTMEHMWTPVAYVEGITAAENAMGIPAEVDYTATPFWTSTIPAISSVGITEQEAKEAGYRIRIGKFPFAANGMATILGQRTGMVKIIADERYGQILGVHIIGPGATDLIAAASLSIRADVTPEDIGATFHAHPSLSEALWEAAKGVNGEMIHSLMGSHK